MNSIDFSIHDLKCGNTLNYQTSEGEILPTVIYWQDLKWLTEDPKGFNLVHSPIPLTEDWLLKFGFERKDSSTCVQWWNGINEITHDWLVDLIWLKEPERIGAPNFPFYRNGKHTIYYVHQLQNLYFALTGEELCVK